METQAYFSDIKQVILRELDNSTNSIFVAVAWFTDNELFDKLCTLQKKGVNVELIILDDEINNLKGPNYNNLQNLKGKVYKIKSQSSDNIMHNKFCIIDNSTIINGSYNWSYKASHNHENITIIKQNRELAQQYTNEFKRIIKLYFNSTPTEEPEFDYSLIYRRLDLIKNLILLQEWTEIQPHIAKLTIYKSVKDVEEIISDLEKEYYSDCISKIENFKSKSQQITKFVDNEIFTLKLEIKSLEIQISSISDEIDETEKLIFDFSIKQNFKLGNLIRRVLELKTELLRLVSINNLEEKTTYEQAKTNYEQFNKEYELNKDNRQTHLNDEQLKEIKHLYRNATKLCHPDVVADELVEHAKEVFTELKNAYDKNDLEKVKKIKNDLEKGHFFKSKSSTISDKELLIIEVRKLRKKLEQMIEELNSLKLSELYLKISNIIDWNEYFEKSEINLSTKLKELESKILEVKNGISKK